MGQVDRNRRNISLFVLTRFSFRPNLSRRLTVAILLGLLKTDFETSRWNLLHLKSLVQRNETIIFHSKASV